MKLIIICLIIAHPRVTFSIIEEYSDDEIDKDNFIDIHSMTEDDSYDLNKIKSGSEVKGAPAENFEVVAETPQISESRSMLKNQNKEAFVSEVKTTIKPKPLPHDRGLIFFQQFTKRILKFIEKESTKVSHSDDVHFYKAYIKLRSNDIKTIKQFANANEDDAKSYMSEAHHIISKSFSYLSLETETPLELTWNFADTFGISSYELLMVSLSIFVFIVNIFLYKNLKLSLYRITRNILLVSFILSIPWNWVYLIKKEISERASKASECSNIMENGASYWDIIAGIIFPRSDKQSQCFQDVLTDPWTTVPPTKAFVFTLGNFVFEPLEYLGIGIKKLLLSTFSDLPVMLWPFASALLLVVIVVPLFVFKEYEWQLPVFMGSIGPSRRTVTRCIKCENSATELRNARHPQITNDTNKSLLNSELAIENVANEKPETTPAQRKPLKISTRSVSSQTVTLTKEVAISTKITEMNDKCCQIDIQPKVKRAILDNAVNES